jgi:transcriptional regulator with XRE-family HTH domain
MTTRLKIERVRKGLSQEELANQVFISRATLSRIENGNSDADPEVKKRLAEILQISENDLFGDDATVTVPEAKKKAI